MKIVANGSTSKFPKAGLLLRSQAGRDIVSLWCDSKYKTLAVFMREASIDRPWQNFLKGAFDFSAFHEFAIIRQGERMAFEVDGKRAYECKLTRAKGFEPALAELVLEDCHAVFDDVKWKPQAEKKESD